MQNPKTLISHNQTWKQAQISQSLKTTKAYAKFTTFKHEFITKRKEHYRHFLAIAKQNPTSKLAINRTRRNRQNPRRMVRNTSCTRSVVAGGADGENSPLDGVEGADGDGVHHVGGVKSTDGDADEIDAIGDGVVEGGEDIGVGAAKAHPTHLVDGDPGSGDGPPSCAGGESGEAGVRD